MSHYLKRLRQDSKANQTRTVKMVKKSQDPNKVVKKEIKKRG